MYKAVRIIVLAAKPAVRGIEDVHACCSSISADVCVAGPEKQSLKT